MALAWPNVSQIGMSLERLAESKSNEVHFACYMYLLKPQKRKLPMNNGNIISCFLLVFLEKSHRDYICMQVCVAQMKNAFEPVLTLAIRNNEPKDQGSGIPLLLGRIDTPYCSLC